MLILSVPSIIRRREYILFLASMCTVGKISSSNTIVVTLRRHTRSGSHRGDIFGKFGENVFTLVKMRKYYFHDFIQNEIVVVTIFISFPL